MQYIKKGLIIGSCPAIPFFHDGFRTLTLLVFDGGGEVCKYKGETIEHKYHWMELTGKYSSVLDLSTPQIGSHV